ncbi:hypothetical protein ACFE04_018978 [Oxalis oulophora]
MYTKHESTRTTTPSSSSSFSSSLLDSIYRSIDDSTESNSGNDLNFYEVRRTNMVKKQNNINGDFNIERERSSLRKAIMIEKWMDKQNGIDVAKVKSFATSSSSNSSIGRVFSSSSDESCCREKIKPGLVFSRQQVTLPLKQETDKKKSVEGFSKSTKIKSMRNIYTELKKVKQPSSPGGKLASFITSIFNSSSNNAKKVSICSSSSSINAMEDISRHTDYKSKSKSKSMSSRSSLTRDHQTPSPRDHNSKYVNDMKRRLARSNYSPQVTKSCSLREIMIKNNSYNEVNANININYNEEEEDDDENNDVLSCSSSDLFELEHIIINGRYREELPVFETTSVKTNQAIANSFLMY